MNRLLAAAVALLVVSTSVSGAVVSPSASAGSGEPASVVQAAEPVNTLSLSQSEIATERVDRITVAPMEALSRDATALQGRFSRYRLRERLDSASSDVQRRVIIDETVTALDRAVDRLAEASDERRQDYVDGEITTREYLQALSETEAKADALDNIASQVAQDAQDVSEISVQDRITEIRYRLQQFHGGVREVVGDVFDGESDARAVYVAAGDAGLVLATVSDGQYVREVHYEPHRQETGDYQVSTIIEASDRIRENYPWVWNHSTSLELEPANTAFYPVGIPHAHGDFLAHLDRRTGNVFYEYQRIDAAVLPSERLVRRAGGSRIVVNYTYVGGPVQLTVLDDDTDEPVDATVSVDGQRVGTTGDDGELWTVAPGENSSISVATGGTNVTLPLPLDRP